MRFKRLLPLCALLLTGALFSVYAQDNVGGVWRIHTIRPDGSTHDVFLALEQSGSSVIGSVIENYGHKKIMNGSFVEGKLHAEINPWREIVQSYDGRLTDGKLNLTVTRKETPASKPEITKATAERSTEEATHPPAKLAIPALHDVPDNGLARTPPMGWNSWNHFAGRVTDATVRATADRIVATGMKDAGYIYVNIDDTWEASRDADGNIVPNKKFPNMKVLADYVHSKGLKIGIYSSPGPLTCGGYEGSYGHEEQDAKAYAEWGIDYLKYDWCSASAIYRDSDMQAVYQKMGDALQASGRPILFSLCQYGKEDVWNWGAKVGGNLWRTTGDIADHWKSLEEIGFSQAKIAEYVQPGHWNDPDMLEVGNGGMTDDEYRTHMTLWALLSAPLLAGNDLDKMSDATLKILTNRDLIAIDQDTAVHHPKRTVLEGNTEVWTREMQDGSTVVALFNRDSKAKQVTADWSKLGIAPTGKVRNLWTQKDVSLSSGPYTATVSKHGVVLLSLGKS